MMDGHQQIGIGCRCGTLARRDVGIDAFDPEGLMAQCRQRTDEGGRQVAVVLIFGTAAGTDGAWVLGAMADIHQDVRGMHRPGAAQGQQGGTQQTV
jgi:hypothetical protein